MEKVESDVWYFGVIFRLPDEIKDGDSGPKISSVSGANRKRKWKDEEDEEEEQKAEESSDLDTSSDDDDDEEVNEATVSESKDTTSPCQETEDKQEVKEEKQNTEQDGQNEKKISDEEKVQDKKLSQPAVFVPVDRSPEIQVCVLTVRVCLRTTE